MDWIAQNWDSLLAIATGLVTVASVVVKLTPSTVDDAWLAAGRRLVETIALNGRPTKVPPPAAGDKP